MEKIFQKEPSPTEKICFFQIRQLTKKCESVTIIKSIFKKDKRGYLQ